MSTEVPSIFRLSCKVQEYPWGTSGESARVAQYAAATPENNFKQDMKQPYAELWMGSAHPNGPSTALLPNGPKALHELILSAPQKIYGKALNRLTETARQKGQLPYLFKTLCAGKALPLQIHPDKKLAEQLHKENPEDLPDDNHKPEIGLALSEFWAFASFREMKVIRQSVERIEELKEALGDSAKQFLEGEESEDKLREAVRTVLQRGKDEQSKMGDLVKKLAKRCKEEGDKAIGGADVDKGLAEAFVMLNDDYEGDAGAFICAFFMNLYKLQPGECIYVPADGIHAWFRGDCIECMANSDNVLNSAFQEIDQDTLDTFNKAVLCPTDHSASKYFVKTEPFTRGGASNSTRYDTPFNEFDLIRTQLPAMREETHGGIQGPSFILVESGSGTLKAGDVTIEAKPGVVCLIIADVELKITASKEGMQTYRCFAE